MRSYILENAGPWAKVGTRLPQVDSTNAELQRRLNTASPLAPLPIGTNVRADFQTDGRGRLGRTWEATAGDNLAVSYLLDDAGLGAQRLFALSQNIALAVCDTVEAFLPSCEAPVAVKWPNDVFVGERKIAGILIETALHADRVAHVVAGIGVNVNQVHFEHAPQATSLNVLGAGGQSVTQVWAALTQNLQTRHRRLRAGGEADVRALADEYEDRLYGRGRLLRFRRLPAGDTFLATVRGVDGAGRLRLARADGHLTFNLDEIALVGTFTP